MASSPESLASGTYWEDDSEYAITERDTELGCKPNDAAIAASKAFLQSRFRVWRRNLPPHMVGPINDVDIRMPLTLQDGRKLTWEKLSTEMTNKIAACNAPACEEDCWLIVTPPECRDSSGYPIKKISHDGASNKRIVHNLLYFMKEGSDVRTPGHELAHTCRRGRYDPSKGHFLVCINPHHVVSCTHNTNISHNGCANGCKMLCPHRTCVWTNEEGRRMWCRDEIPLPMVCACGNFCHGNVPWWAR